MVTLSRIFKYGWQGFLRNGWLSASTIGIMILSLLVFEGLILFNVVTKRAIASLQEKIDISVYFKSNASEDFILNMKRSLEGLAEVKNVEYVSEDEALQNFKARHASDDVIIQTLAELDTNPLLPSLNVKAKDPKNYGSIASYLDNQSLKDSIEKISYAQNQVIINKLNSLSDSLRTGGLGLTLFLAFLSVMVIFNTIRLAIFSSSEQINIMRLVGASNSFIRGPYMIEGIIYGLIAAFVSFLIFIPFINMVSPYISNFIPEMNLKSYFGSQFLALLIYQILFGVGLGLLSSSIAIRRYLRA